MGVTESSGGGRSVLPCAHRRRVRPDHHLRYGRAAPRNHRRSHEARVQRRGTWVPQVAYRERSARRSNRKVSSSQSGGRAVGRLIKPEPNGAGQGLRVRRRHQGRCVPREYIPVVDKGPLGDAAERCAGRLPRLSMSRSPCSTAPTTMWTRTKTRSRWRRPWRSRRRRCAKASPVLLEPMMAVVVKRQKTTCGQRDGRSVRRAVSSRVWMTFPAARRSSRRVPLLAEMFGYATTAAFAGPGSRKSIRWSSALRRKRRRTSLAVKAKEVIRNKSG